MQPQSNFQSFDLSVKNGEANLIFSYPQKKECFFRVKKSQDGLSFINTDERLKITSLLSRAENPDHIFELAAAKITDSKHFLAYTKKDQSGRLQLYGATSKKGISWKKIGPIPGVKSFGMIVPEYLFEKHHLLYYGSHSIKIASSTDLKKWHISASVVIRPRKSSFDRGSLKVARILNVDEGIALFYFSKNAHRKLCLGAALLDKQSPGKVIWRAKYPLWVQPDNWVADKTHILGIVQTEKEFVAYFQHGRGEVFVHKLYHGDEAAARKLQKQLAKKSGSEKMPALDRFPKNPIIEPRGENDWEAAATFNPAALYIDDRIHIVYRAQDYNGISVFGYAASSDGINIDERLNEPIYYPKQSFEMSPGKLNTRPYFCLSGGGWGGCEDPRLTRIDDRIYLIYVAFNGSQPPGVALTSISTDNFLKKIWDWRKPKLISRPGQIQKNWVIFPEKINGKFAVMHSISPKISIDYFDSLDADDVMIESFHTYQQYDNKDRWDNIMRGVGAPPLKTDYGWLILYHAMDRRDPNRYKVGAMLLDYSNPEKILARCQQPILEPDEKYENEGYKSGVVYVCGAVIKDDKLIVYYGGADTYVAVASAPLKEFLDKLMAAKDVKLNTQKIK